MCLLVIALIVVVSGEPELTFFLKVHNFEFKIISDS